MKVKAILNSGYFANARHASNYIAYIDRQSPIFDQNGTEKKVLSAQADVEAPGNSTIWYHVYSLNASDCERLEVNRNYMKNLIALKADEMAKAYNISPSNLRMVCSWHNKDFHPHLHFLVWSTDSREAFIPHREKETDKNAALNAATRTVKSCFTNEIFRGDLAYLKEEKSAQRDKLNEQLRRLVSSEYLVDREITDSLKTLGKELRATKGKHTYKFLSPPLKAQVDNVLEQIMRRDPILKSMYEEYLDSQKELVLTYASYEDTLDKKFAEIENSFFHPYCDFEERRAGRAEVTRHNIIIQAAERYAGPAVRKKIASHSAPQKSTSAQAVDRNGTVPAHATTNICSRLCSTVRTLPRLNTKASWPPTAKKGNIATRMPSCTPASLTPETRHKHKAPGRKGPAWGVFYKEKSMFIKLYNALFDFGLKPKELKVYVYLSACQNCLGTATVRSATVQERCGMSEHTVRTAIAGLAQKGLVTVCPRRDRNGQQIAHAYKLRYLSGGWCRLPLDALSLPARDFAVYAYLCRCANRLRKAFPSFTHMANALRVAVTTVQTAIKNLAAAGLLLKAAFRAGKHNLYILVDAKKEAACGQTQTAVHKAHKNKITIPFLGRACQVLGRFFGDAVCQILRSSNKTNPTYSTEGRTISPSRRILTGEVRPAQPECKGRSVPLAGQELIGGARRYFFLCTALQSLWQAAIIWDRRMQNDDGGNQIQAGGEGVPVRRAGGLQGQAADQARQSGPCPRKRREEKGAVPRSSGG